jgi:hypothetical protein
VSELIYEPAQVELPAPAGWPQAPEPCAYYGLPGAIVAAISPHTEADPVAILAQLLVACGALIGRGAHFRVEASRHHPNEFCLLIGDTAKARKGSSFDHVARLLCAAEPDFQNRLTTGLSSGEGLIWSVRDPEGPDAGAKDARLLITEPEFASVLKSTAREISTLSPVLRSAWDARPLALLTRTAPARASAAHIAIIGHITASELAHHTTRVELANGFLNRFILLACRRVRLLPEGGDPEPLAGTGLTAVLSQTLKHAARAGHLTMDEDTRIIWRDVYPRLSEAQDGLPGALCARAEAHTVRLALTYALLDGGRQIKPAHLHAALALWNYAARCAHWALGRHTGDPLAEQIHAALTRSPDGLTRTQLRDLFARNRSGQQIEQALASLAAAGRASGRQAATAGRPAELWSATPPPVASPARETGILRAAQP